MTPALISLFAPSVRGQFYNWACKKTASLDRTHKPLPAVRGLLSQLVTNAEFDQDRLYAPTRARKEITSS